MKMKNKFRRRNRRGEIMDNVWEVPTELKPNDNVILKVVSRNGSWYFNGFECQKLTKEQMTTLYNLFIEVTQGVPGEENL